VEEFFVEGSGGVRLHCVSPGRRPGKPLMLFLHGFPELWYSWRYQMAAFAEDYDGACAAHAGGGGGVVVVFL
jgi:pimeloyl-ACP methyl ester carboxylesterase